MPDRGTCPAALAASLGVGLYRELVDALRDDSFLKQGGLVGVPCMYLYCQVRWRRLSALRLVFGRNGLHVRIAWHQKLLCNGVLVRASYILYNRGGRTKFSPRACLGRMSA